jgi:dTDP-4-dehydrorhamnose reductase
VSVRRVGIIGASGQLGTALVEAFAGRQVLAPAHAALDLQDRAALDAFLDGAQPDLLINCAAFHHVDTCEREPGRAFAMNALAVDGAAEACAARGIAFATISTDYVFDGTLGRAYRENDAANPRTAYGVSKLAGELLTRRHGSRHYVFRASGVFGTMGTSNKGYTLIEKVLQQADRGELTRMVSDMIFSPTYAPDAARAIRDVVDAKLYGTHHVTNTGACSWYEFVRTAFLKTDVAEAPLEPISYASFGNPTPRPMYSPLENTTFASAGITPMPAWESALDAFLTARRSRLAASAG